MKKLLLILFVFVFVSGANAQRYKGGLRIGLNASALTAPLGQPTDQIATVLGIHVGGYGRMSVSNSFRIQLELLYSQRGGAFDNLDNDGDGQNMWGVNFTDLKNEVKLAYIDIPILASFHGRGSSFLVGFQPSFLVNTTQTLTGNQAEQDFFMQQFNNDLSNFQKFNSFDISVILGFELELDMGLNFGLRGSYGLLNTLNQGTVDNVEAKYPNEFDQLFRFSNFHNVTLQFTVGYTFGGAK
jgi:Outer membrane protein beta-barrel domain